MEYLKKTPANKIAEIAEMSIQINVNKADKVWNLWSI